MVFSQDMSIFLHRNVRCIIHGKWIACLCSWPRKFNCAGSGFRILNSYQSPAPIVKKKHRSVRMLQWLLFKITLFQTPVDSNRWGGGNVIIPVAKGINVCGSNSQWGSKKTHSVTLNETQNIIYTKPWATLTFRLISNVLMKMFNYSSPKLVQEIFRWNECPTAVNAKFCPFAQLPSWVSTRLLDSVKVKTSWLLDLKRGNGSMFFGSDFQWNYIYIYLITQIKILMSGYADDNIVGRIADGESVQELSGTHQQPPKSTRPRNSKLTSEKSGDVEPVFITGSALGRVNSFKFRGVHIWSICPGHNTSMY